MTRCAGNSCEADVLTRRPTELAAQLVADTQLAEMLSWGRRPPGGVDQALQAQIPN